MADKILQQRLKRASDLKEKSDKEGVTEKCKDEESKRSRPRSSTDLQRLRVEKLMQNPEKPVDIPQSRTERGPRKAREFIRHIMGSSAAAGSGDFHIYRGVRRRENEREAWKDKMSKQDDLDEEWEKRRDQHQREAVERVEKNRAKRLKKKSREEKRKKVVKGKEKVARAAGGGSESRVENGDSTANTGDSVVNHGESMVTDGDSAAKAGDSAAKAGDSAAKAGDSAAKAGDSAVKDGDSAVTDTDPAVTDGDSVINTGDSVAHTGDSVANTGDSVAEVVANTGEDSDSDTK